LEVKIFSHSSYLIFLIPVNDIVNLKGKNRKRKPSLHRITLVCYSRFP